MQTWSQVGRSHMALGLFTLALVALVFGVAAPEALAAPPPTPPPGPLITINNTVATESSCAGVNAVFTVQLSRQSQQVVSVRFATANGSASAPGDYQGTTGTLTFQPRERTKSILVPILSDQITEEPETFVVNLSAATNGTITDAQGVGRILNDQCDDADSCTTDSCNPATLACQYAEVSCDDNNVCTSDSCNPSGGCQHQAIDLGQTTCGTGTCERTVQACVNGVPQTCTPGTPTAEVCNGLDDDCNGTVDGPGSEASCQFANATATCTGGVCAIAACNAGFGDCDGINANGCENPLDSLADCGSCGNVCVLANATTSCAADVCAIATCNTGYGDCDGIPANGCEADTNTNPSNCGECNTACTAPVNATGTCASGICGFQCNQGYTQCSGSCFNLPSDPDNCGACGNVCGTPANGSAACVAGACAIAGCTSGFADCNGAFADGCESDLNRPTARTASEVSPAYPLVYSGVPYSEGITNCGACGENCDDGNSCTTDVCIPFSGCRHFNRNICATARCSGNFVPIAGDGAGDQSACAAGDVDGDNIPNAWEVSSINPVTGTTNPVGIDINCDGIIDPSVDFIYPDEHQPHPNTKDVYLRIRAMGQRDGSFAVFCFTDEDCLNQSPDEPYCNLNLGTCSDEPSAGHRLSEGVIELLKSRFLAHGIRLHVDYNRDEPIPHYDFLKFSPDDACTVEPSTTFFPVCDPTCLLPGLKETPYWSDRLRYLYHYAVLAHEWCVDPDISGNSEIIGNDMSITLGTAPFGLNSEDRKYMEAGTLMHELGHNLGLSHLLPARGPNHLSVMNYRYQFTGILTADYPFTNPPTGSVRRIDYSTEELPTLNESHLDETLILKPGSDDIVTYECGEPILRKAVAGLAIDWDCDGDTFDTDVEVNINGVTPITFDSLPGREEWQTLRYEFQCSSSFVNLAPEQGASGASKQGHSEQGPALSVPLVAGHCDEVNACMPAAAELTCSDRRPARSGLSP